MTRIPLITLKTALTAAALLAGYVTAWFLIFGTHLAFSHEAPSGQVYPAWCCQGISGTSGHGDCAPIPSSAVTTDSQGEWVITLKAGDHPLATRPHVFKRAYGDRLPSIDGRFHLCLYPTEDKAQCFLAPPEGS